MLQLEHVGFRYAEREILRDVSLTVAAGELVCAVGPNGAGKTTLLRIAAGLLPAAGGTVRVGGTDPRQIPRRALARRLAFLPQDYHVVFPFTVAEVVLMGRYPYHGALALDDPEDQRLANEAMRRCDVIALGHRRFDALSGGERRRALLAQAFCQAADSILLDEPTASLDPAHAIAVFEILVERKKASLVVTHDLNLAARFADRVVLLDGGAITADGPPADVLTSAAAARAFGVALHVGQLPGGARFVVPM